MLRLALVLAALALLAVPVAAQQVPQSRAEISLSYAPVVRAAAPAVVTIYTAKRMERRRNPFMGDPFFEQFFGELFDRVRPEGRVRTSLGSGVIVDPGGIVVSNHHVIAGADEISVVLADGRAFEGEVILADADSDLAVIALEGAEGLPALALRDSATLEVGDLVLAIGNPFGVGQTVTSGIVSGLARAVPGQGPGRGLFVQTDAAINPGNSGGALVDMSGRLVGVPTTILSRSGGSNGIGFAVPSEMVARVIASARAGAGTLERPWLGVGAQRVDASLAEALGYDRPRGLLIDMLHPASPLAEAGLEAGDVILTLGGSEIDSPAALVYRSATLGTGARAEIVFLRDGEERRAEVALEPAPEEPARDPRTLRGALGGVRVETVNPATIEEAGLPLTAEGVLVRAVEGRARLVGLRPGDVIAGVDGREVATTGDFLAALEAARGEIVLKVLRDGRRGTIRIRS